MRYETKIDAGMNQRNNLIRIMEAAAEFLASRDTDIDSQAEAAWRLGRGPNGEPLISLALKDQDYTRTQNFSPNQLEPTESREYRLISVWNHVLRERARREIARVNELLSQYEGD